MVKNNKGMRKLIALLAILFLGEAYTSGLGGKGIEEYENVVYKFESVYPDVETMNLIENSTNIVSTK